MIKILGRISIIMTAALVVVGVALGLSQSSYAQNMTPPQGGFEQRQVSSTTVGNSAIQNSTSGTTSGSQTFNRDNASGGFGRTGGQSGSLFGIVQVAMNFIIITIIVLPFVVVSRFLSGRKAGLPNGPPQPPLDQTTYA